MKKIIILGCFFLFISCNDSNKYNQENIKQFEKTLGKQETIYLNEILTDFDNYLAKKYPNGNLDSKYKTYLKDFSKLNIIDYWKIDSIKLIKYRRNSKLFTKYDTIYPDSIWQDGRKSFSYRFPDEKYIAINNNTFFNSIIYLRYTNIDSVINVYKKKPKYIINEPSNFYLVINSIKHKDSMLMNYFEVKEALGEINPEILSNELHANLDNNPSYFSKPIFIMEFNEFLNINDSY